MEKQLIENVSPHSVELYRNGKGETTITVKVYADDELEAGRRALAALNTLRAEVAKE